MENLYKLKTVCSSTISFIKQLTKDEIALKELEQCTNFLTEFYTPTLKQRIYHFYHEIFATVNCVHCGNPSTWNKFDAINYNEVSVRSKNYNQFCEQAECQSFKNKLKMKKQLETMNVSNCSQLPSWKSTKIKNCLEKHGVEWYNQTSEYKEKLKSNSLERYGVDHYTKLESVQEKKKQTCLEKYGVDNITKLTSTQDKIKNTCIERYAYTSASKNEMIKDKIKQTNQLKYGKDWFIQTESFKYKTLNKYEQIGVTHCSQISGTVEKRTRAGFRWKDYVLPSGKVIKVQGYENIAMDRLLETYSEDDIVTDNKDIENYIGKIFYEHDNKKHRYFPDIYVISTNTLIEVKSQWTYNSQKSINLIKANVASTLANFEFMII